MSKQWLLSFITFANDMELVPTMSPASLGIFLFLMEGIENKRQQEKEKTGRIKRSGLFDTFNS